MRGKGPVPLLLRVADTPSSLG